MYLAADSGGALSLDLNPVDLVLMAIYFSFVLGIGFALKRAVKSSLDFFLSGRSLPAWVTGIGFISANIGAVELLGQSASGAQYGSAMVHYFWIGAIPAMVFLGIVMMPFYYGSKVRSVPEYLRLRFDPKAHLINAITFVVGSMLIAGVNLYALSIVLEALLGIKLILAIMLAAVFVLSYILLGGLTSAIYNEVMQFFVVLVGMVPLTIIAIKETGGLSALFDKLSAAHGSSFVHPWSGTGIGGSNPVGDWIGIILGLAFCLSFGYWTTNFAEVQRAMAARDGNSARLTPIIGAYPKAFVPLITILPGMAALVLLPGIGTAGSGLEYNDAIPALMDKYLPPGVLGVAVTGLLAAFMAGMAANVSSFNAVFTYDLWQDYIRPGRSDRYYLMVGRWATVGGVAVAVMTALIASGFSNISNYLQTFSRSSMCRCSARSSSACSGGGRPGVPVSGESWPARWRPSPCTRSTSSTSCPSGVTCTRRCGARSRRSPPVRSRWFSPRCGRPARRTRNCTVWCTGWKSVMRRTSPPAPGIDLPWSSGSGSSCSTPRCTSPST